MSPWLRGMAALVLAGCASAAAPGPDLALPPRSPAGVPGLRVALVAPKDARYKLDVFGLGGAPITVRITNVGHGPVPVDDLNVAFAASRGGVAYPCRASATVPKGHEPRTLEPDQSFVYRRTLDCSLPVPGTYAVAAYAAFGRAPRLGDASDAVGSFDIRLTGADKGVPQPYPAVDGLYVGVSGNPFARPLPPKEWAKGNFGVVVALINASPREIDGLTARVVFRVYRVGQTLACLEQPVPLDVPAVLGPGAMYTRRIPVTCVMDTPGDYDVVGSLELLDVQAQPMELDRFRVTVTDDPLLFAPPLQPHIPKDKETTP